MRISYPLEMRFAFHNVALSMLVEDPIKACFRRYMSLRVPRVQVRAVKCGSTAAYSI